MSFGVKRKKEELFEIAQSFGYLLLDDYNEANRRKRIIIQDSIGYKYDVLLTNFMKTMGKINFIDTRNPFSLENISLWLKLNRNHIKLSDESVYRGINKPLIFLNIVANIKFSATWNSVYHSDCSYFKKEKIKRTAKKNIVNIENRLSILFPEISKEWDYDKNEDTPDDVSYGTHKKRWWRCSKGHSYESSVDSRTISFCGCGKCSEERKESSIATELKNWCLNNFLFADIEHKMFKNPETNKWLKCDIYIGNSNDAKGIYIEVHGIQHYKLNYFHKLQGLKTGKTPEEQFEYNKNLDKIKKKFAKKNGTYVEIDLRKVKRIDDAIKIINNICITTDIRLCSSTVEQVFCKY